MIAFTSFPVPPDNDLVDYGAARHHPDVEEDVLMDLDQDFEHGALKLTCPGESLTSAQTFMR
jgi:exosome complex component RRP4